MWLKNARELRLTPWVNDPLAIDGAEVLEYCDAAGRYSLFADDDGAPCRVTFGFGFAVWEKSFGSFASRCTAFVPPDMDARVMIIEFFGEHSGKLGWKCELLMSDSDNDRGAVACSYVSSVFTARLYEGLISAPFAQVTRSLGLATAYPGCTTNLTRVRPG